MVVVPTLAGKLSQSRWGIPSGIPVAVAMGDLQCSVYSVQAAINEAGRYEPISYTLCVLFIAEKSLINI